MTVGGLAIRCFEFTATEMGVCSDKKRERRVRKRPGRVGLWKTKRARGPTPQRPGGTPKRGQPNTQRVGGLGLSIGAVEGGLERVSRAPVSPALRPADPGGGGCQSNGPRAR